MIWALRAVAAALCVWIPLLVIDLKSSGATHDVVLAWMALDLTELAALAGIIDCSKRSHRNTPWVAVTAASLFTLDAALDLLSSVTPHGMLVAALMALAAELPTAALCLALGWRVHGSQAAAASRFRSVSTPSTMS